MRTCPCGKLLPPRHLTSLCPSCCLSSYDALRTYREKRRAVEARKVKWANSVAYQEAAKRITRALRDTTADDYAAIRKRAGV